MEQKVLDGSRNRSSAIITTPVKYCLYARKSSEQDELQSLSIESQVKEMSDLANKHQLEVVDIRRESHSAKAANQRPVYNQLLEDVRTRKFNGILTWAPDRLSRNAGDLGALVDLMDQKALVEVRTFGQQFTNTPNEKFLLMILGAQGKLENDQKGVNVKRGLRARCEQGLWPSEAPTGYLNDKSRDRKCHVVIDPQRAPVIKQMFDKVAYESYSGRKLYRWLRSEVEFKTKYGKLLVLSNVYRILGNSFYTGIFEYPVGSGNWYTGKHTPIVTKEIFDKVQEQLRGNYVSKTESKEFAFTRLMKCGLCGSGITADEKFKKLKDGSVNRYVYYLCTKSRDINCKNPYINEKDLINQFVNLMDTIDLDEIGIRDNIKNEIERYNKFRTIVLGNQKEKTSVTDLDIRNYAKYILKEGTMLEKREMLLNLKTQLILSRKTIRGVLDQIDKKTYNIKHGNR